MNRGDMRTLVRERVKDKNTIRWTDAELDLELNLAGQDIASQLAAHATVSHCRKTFDLTTAGGTDPYPITETDFHSVRDMRGGLNHMGGRQIADTEYDKIKQQYPDGIDDEHKYVYYVVYYPNTMVKVDLGSPTAGTFTLTFKAAPTAGIAYGATAADVQAALILLAGFNEGDVTVTGEDGGPYTIEIAGQYAGRSVSAVTGDGSSLTDGTFVVSNYHYAIQFVGVPSQAFTVVYNILVPAIATGSGNDTQSFSTVPVQYHELVVQRVVAMALGHASARTAGFAFSLYAHLAQQAGWDVASRADAFRTGP